MKKLLLFLIIGTLAFAGTTPVQAQLSLYSQYGLPVDTTNNATSLTKYMTVQGAVLGLKVGTVHFWADKISGTVSATATLQYSTDGVKYYSLPRDSVYTLTDLASQGFGWQLPEFTDKYIRVKFVGTGTMSAKVAGNYSFIKPNSP